MRAFRTILLLLATIAAAFADGLYLLGGTPEPVNPEGHASVLYSMQDGKLQIVRTINTIEEPSRFIRINHESRSIVIGQNTNGGNPAKLWFVDMDNPRVSKEWNAETDPLVGKKPTQTWTGFLRLPGGIRFAIEVYSSDVGSQLLGVRESAGVYEFQLLPSSYKKYAEPSGWSGYGTMDAIGLTFEPTSQTGRQRALVPPASGGAEVFNSIPPTMLSGRKSGALQARNSFVSVLRLVIDRSDGTQGYGETMVLHDEEAGKWQSWWVSGNSRTGPHATVFGPWVVATETADTVPGVKLPPERRYTKEDHELPSRWDTKVPTGPHLRARRHYLKTRPGRMHMLHVPSGRTLVLEPGDPDSEILLIEGKTIYYRANDEIYSALLTDSGIGPRKLLAKGEEILDVHWAFLSATQ